LFVKLEPEFIGIANRLVNYTDESLFNQRNNIFLADFCFIEYQEQLSSSIIEANIIIIEIF